MKKIIGLTIAAVMVVALVGIGTWAYFSDTETSTGNTLSAGTLDLKVATSAGAYGDAAVTTFSVSNIKPGDSGNGSTRLANNGSINGNLSVNTSAVTNTAGTTGEFAGGSGELGAAAEMAVYIDVNQNGAFDAGDIGLKSDGTTYLPTTLEYAAINSYTSKTWNNIETMTPTTEDNLRVEWRLTDSGDQNSLQGDSVSINFTFTLMQS
jgi:predicted ribosomally synthesized peptide with SipW-like signal peptide